MPLSDFQQAVLMFAAFALAPVGAWFGLGANFDHASLALLGSGLIGGILAFIKEYSGGSSPAPAVALGPQIGELSDGTPVYGPAPKATG